MSYKTKLEEQRKFDYKEFLQIVEKIEQNFTDNVCEKICGRCIYVLLGGAFEQTYFEKTTISDLRFVLGKINFDCIIDNSGNFGNIVLYSLREPGKKDFRNKIKYTPKGTISVSLRAIGVNEDGTRGVSGWDKLPFLQDEKFVNKYCDEMFLKNEEGADYDYLERNAFHALANDKRFRCGDDYILTRPGIEQQISRDLHCIICNIYDAANSWSVWYYFGGNHFIFPLKREYIQELFKNRDKENGRRRVIASLVRGYKRKDGVEVDGHLRTHGGFSIDGREFEIGIGTDDIEKYYPKTDKPFKRAKKMLENSIEIPGTDFAYVNKR